MRRTKTLIEVGGGEMGQKKDCKREKESIVLGVQRTTLHSFV